MRNRLVSSLALLLVSASLTLSGCASSLCARKEAWLKNHCAGTDVTWSHDATCERAIEHCDEGHLAQMQGYVSCLESQNVCSLDTMNQCGQQYPGGVNLSCPATN